MAVIKPSCVRDLKQRIDLADVVMRVVALRKAGGSRMKGLCPFHAEKTPSFNVDSAKGYYHCFGCGKGGDAISFVQETEQLSFTEAVEALGKRFAFAIEYEAGSGPSAEERSLRQELFDLHDQAVEHYREAFLGPGAAGPFMREYWTASRRFPAELAEEFKIGAAPAEDPGLAARLLKRRYSEDALRQCGLFFLRDGAPVSASTLRPRFRGRLMIPIRDHQGRVVAFTARQTALTPADDPAREAKYVNSPETPVFSKGGLLFNLDRARTAAGEGRPFVLVEGQLDAMRCWQVGLRTAVAPQGTSITESQLALLRRYHPQVECLFDSDSAGQKASLRLLPLSLKAGVEVRFLGLSGSAKVDPDLLFLERGLAAYDDLKASSSPAMAFACRALLPDLAAASPEQKSQAARTILEWLMGVESEVSRAGFIAEAAACLRLPHAALAADFVRLADRGSGRPGPRPSAGGQPQTPAATGPGAGAAGSMGAVGATGVAGALAAAGRPGARQALGPVTPEEDLLRLCLHYEAIGPTLSAALPHDWIDAAHPAGILLNRFIAEFENGAWPGRDHLDVLLETPDEKSLVASILFDSPAIDNPLKVAAEGLTRLRTRALEPRLQQIALALANSATDSTIDPHSLLRERSDLQRQLREPIRLVAADGVFSS